MAMRFFQRFRPHNEAADPFHPTSRRPFLTLSRRGSRPFSSSPSTSSDEPVTYHSTPHATLAHRPAHSSSSLLIASHPASSSSHAPPPDVVHYGHASASAVLREPLIESRGPLLIGASRNSGLAMETVKALQYVLHPWRQVFTPWFEKLYLGLIDSVRNVAAHPQSMRVLEQEADVGDVVFSNVLEPVVSILNRLIKPELKDQLEVTVQHQASESLTLEVWDEEAAKTVDKVVAVRIDHAVVLVPRNGAQGRYAQQDFARAYLGIVEEKRHGYVDDVMWQPPQGLTEAAQQAAEDEYFARDNVVAHLDQLTLYMGEFRCNYFLLTDYKDGVAVQLCELEKDGKNKPIVRLSPRPCDPRFQSPYTKRTNIKGKEGLRHAVCTLAMRAMHELNILDTTEPPSDPSTRSRKGKDSMRKKEQLPEYVSSSSLSTLP